MKFKIDENLPVEVATGLINAGHDVHSVYEEGLAGSDDDRVFEACKRESRVIVTLDLDFADTRRYPPNQSPGIVIVRAGFQEKEHLVSLVGRIVPLLETERLEQHLWIIDEGIVRIRGDE